MWVKHRPLLYTTVPYSVTDEKKSFLSIFKAFFVYFAQIWDYFLLWPYFFPFFHTFTCFQHFLFKNLLKKKQNFINNEKRVQKWSKNCQKWLKHSQKLRQKLYKKSTFFEKKLFVLVKSPFFGKSSLIRQSLIRQPLCIKLFVRIKYVTKTVANMKWEGANSAGQNYHFTFIMFWIWKLNIPFISFILYSYSWSVQ